MKCTAADKDCIGGCQCCRDHRPRYKIMWQENVFYFQPYFQPVNMSAIDLLFDLPVLKTEIKRKFASGYTYLETVWYFNPIRD